MRPQTIVSLYGLGQGMDRIEKNARVPDFDALYRDHFDFVWRAVRRLAGPGLSTEDIVQDVFLVVHRRLATFEGRAALRTWLYGIARNAVREHRRRERRKGGLLPLDFEPAAQGQGPQAHSERRQALTRLQVILAKMPDAQREVFVAVDVMGLSSVEAAQALGAKTNTVYSRLRLARSFFEAALPKDSAASGGDHCSDYGSSFHEREVTHG